MNKKIIFLLLGIFVFLLFSMLSVSAVNITAPANNTNQSTTMTVTCGTSLQGVLNVTVWYNSTNPGDAGNPTTEGILFTQANSSVNQTTFSNTSVSLVSLTETADYSFWCQFINQTIQNQENTTAVAGITVDNTAPTVTIHTSYTNATVKTNAERLTLNITVTDSILGLADGAVCFITVNGTGTGTFNQTVDLTKSSSTLGTCNTTVLNLTDSSDDAYRIEVYVNDSLNYRLNNSMYVIVDTTAPTATASCSPATVQSGASFPCSCSGSDATSGVSSTSGSTTSSDGTGSTSSTGSYTYTCTIEDNAGNSASATATYTVTQPPGSGGGSGGSSTDTTGDVEVESVNVFTKITPGVVSIMKNIDDEIGVEEIQIDVINEAQNVQISVKKYDGKPSEVSVEKTGKVYRYIEIETQNLEDALQTGTIVIKVEKSWVSDNGLNVTDIRLYKFDNNSSTWNELTTTYYTESDDTYYYYEAEVDSFSYFSIAGKAVVEEETPEEEEEISSVLNKWWFWLIIVAIAVLIGVGYKVSKKR